MRVIVALSALIGCQVAVRPETKLAPPAGVVSESEGPASACTELAPAAPPTSSASAPLRATSSIQFTTNISLAGLGPQVDAQIPNVSDPSFPRTHKVANGVCASWFFDRQGARVAVNGRQLAVTIPGGFGAVADPHTDVFGCTQPFVSCGDKSAGVPAIPVEVRLRASLAVDAAYHLTPTLTNDGVAFLQPCTLAFGINVTPTLKTFVDAGIGNALPAINSALANHTSFRAPAEKIWNALQQPLQLDASTWLVVTPASISASITTVDANTLAVHTAVTGTIELADHAKATTTTTPLPTLGTAVPVQPGIHVTMVSTLAYGEVTRVVAASVKGKAFVADRFSFRINDVRVTGPVTCADATPGCVLVELALAGDVCGTVYLTARPFVDNHAQELRLIAVDFSLATSSLLVGSAARVGRTDIVNHIQTNAHISITSTVTRARALMDGALKRSQTGPWWITGVVSNETAALGVDGTGIILSIDLHGSLNVAF